MAKVSTNPITSYDQNWGEDTSNNLPYSGEAVQKFIKDELKGKISQVDAEQTIENAVNSKVFGGEEGTIVTDVTGNNKQLLVSYRTPKGTGTHPIDIAVSEEGTRSLVVSAGLSTTAINLGGEVKLNYGVAVINNDDGKVLEGADATVRVTIKRQGSSNVVTIPQTAVLGTKNIGDYSTSDIDITSEVQKACDGVSGRVTITVEAVHTYTRTYDDNGTPVTETKTVTSQGSAVLEVLSLVLNKPQINIANTGLSGQVILSYEGKGNGTKTIYLYRNGTLVSQQESTVYNYHGEFIVQSLPVGITNFQIVAETRSGDTTVNSSSFYFDLFGSATGTIIAFMIEDITGKVQGSSDYTSPAFSAPKFNDFKFDYYIFNPIKTIVDAKITTDELDADGRVVISSVSDQVLERRTYIYSKKIKSSNNLRITFNADDAERQILINPLASSVNIELPTDSLKLNLDADGRSNEEVNPAIWKYGDVDTEFSGLNWQSNGWINNSLLLQNGAKAKINFPLFQAVNSYPVTATGCTFEILFKCSNATLEEHDIISCHWINNDGRKTGLNITTNYVGVDTGEVTEYVNEDKEDESGNPLVTQVATRVGSQYAQDTYYKFTFVIDPHAPSVGVTNGLCYGYLNGILSYVAPAPSSFVNLNKLPIIVDSTYADVSIKSIKYYDEPLSHDNCVDEFIIDQSTATEIEEIYADNEVLGTASNGTKYVSPEKLRAMGRGVMIITGYDTENRRNIIDTLNRSTDKKGYFGPVRIDYYAPALDINLGSQDTPVKGNPYNFMHKECAIRIQGTTSTKRPRKNYRLHYNIKEVQGDDKIRPAAGAFVVGGVPRGGGKKDFNYAMSANAVAVPITCLKVDFVDSSMTHNTGGAMIFNELTKSISALRNPAQNKELADGTPVNKLKTRVAIEGFPIDVFAADRLAMDTDNGEYREELSDGRYSNLVYIGQYNFNNDKSKSGKAFGFDGSYTYNEDGTYNEEGAYQPICLEFLDNSAALDLFKVKFTASGNIDDAATYNSFADALEVRAPEDVTDFIGDYGLDALATAEDLRDDAVEPTPNTFKYIPSQIKRVFNFIGECAKQVAQSNSKSVVSLNTMTSDELEALDWTSEKFINEVNDYFNLSSVCAWYIWTDYLIAADQRAKNMMMYTMDGKHWMFQYYDGDTMLGERNDCFLAYDYLTDRTTWDDAVKQYAFQGHDSWLWYLLRANFSDQRVIDGEPDVKTVVNLSSVCDDMRKSGKFSAEYFKQILNGQFVGNFSERQYNYSQEYKYITPLIETKYPTSIGTNYINTAQGSREAHRSYTLDNRFPLLDSKYKAGGYTEDAINYYAAENSRNRLKIVSSIPYYFAWRSDNTGIRDHQVANASNDFTVNFEVFGNSANNPANILGASRIKELHFDPSAYWTVDSAKSLNLPNLQKLVANGMGNHVAGDLYLTGCPLLTYIDLSGSNFSGLYGLQNSSKMEYLNVEDTNIKSIRIADGSPLHTIALAAPQEVYLSNLNNIVFTNGEGDTLTAQNWGTLSKLLINNCPKVDWEQLVLKLLNSSANVKYLRVTGIDKKDSITWLDQFDGLYGLDTNGGELITGAQLVGTLQLLDYTDDTLVEQYRAKFPSLDIKQPEYTIIETNENVAGETSTTENSMGSTTNLDNKTGYRYSSTYIPSGHILNILNRCHRYLGKLVTPGNSVTLEGNPQDPAAYGRQFQGRDNKGTMLLCQLADTNSTFFNTGYGSSTTRRTANLDGLIGHGEVYVKIPGFWYKGINYTPANSSRNISFRYTCYSSYEERPSKSDETRVLSIESLKKSLIDDGNDEGLYKENITLERTEMADSVIDREIANNNIDVYRVRVQGYKKVRFPASVGTGCCLFTDENGKILTNSTGSVVGTGEVFTEYANWLYTGMPVMANIPAGAIYFYIVVKKFVNNKITADPCDIVLHKGSKFSSGTEMTDANAKEWIADMEPEWVYSDPVCIAAAECASDTGLLYTSFDGTQVAAKGTENKENILTSKEQWFQYSMRDVAYRRGLQLIDYEATKLIANLFVAKYGRRNSQNQLGAGSLTNARKLGNTREYGMTDTVIPDEISVTEAWNNAAIPIISGNNKTFKNIGSPNFLGIENIHGNVGEWLDRTYYANETAADCGKIRITNPDLTTRRLYSITPSGNYPKSLVHGKYCDIACCSSQSGTSTTFYPDYQTTDSSLRSEWKLTRALLRSGHYSYVDGGVFYWYANLSVGYSVTASGSRLIFRGNIIETTDIDEFMETVEWRGEL